MPSQSLSNGPVTSANQSQHQQKNQQQKHQHLNTTARSCKDEKTYTYEAYSLKYVWDYWSYEDLLFYRNFWILRNTNPSSDHVFHEWFMFCLFWKENPTKRYECIHFIAFVFHWKRVKFVVSDLVFLSILIIERFPHISLLISIWYYRCLLQDILIVFIRRCYYQCT